MPVSVLPLLVAILFAGLSGGPTVHPATLDLTATEDEPAVVIVVTSLGDEPVDFEAAFLSEAASSGIMHHSKLTTPYRFEATSRNVHALLRKVDDGPAELHAALYIVVNGVPTPSVSGSAEIIVINSIPQFDADRKLKDRPAYSIQTKTPE